MIQQQTLCLKISKIDDNSFKILTGIPKDFITDQTILIGNNNPNLLWNLLYTLLGLPMPTLVEPQKIIKEYLEKEARKKPKTIELEEPKISEPIVEDLAQKEITPLEKELSTMSASDIVAKVLKEKGIQITNSLKSKAAIINKAIKIYENNLDLPA